MSRTLPVRRCDLILAMLFAGHVALTILLWFHLRHGSIDGDEAYYQDAGKALSNAVRDLGALRGVDTGELQRSVVGNGWFMPGMPALLMPLYLVAPYASHGVSLAYLGVVTTVLLGWVTLAVRRELGSLYAGALLVVPGLAPTWVVFGLSFWADMAAGLVLVLMLTELLRIHRRAMADERPGWLDGLRLGLLAIAMVYLRSSTTLVVALACGSIVVALILRRRRDWLRTLGIFVVAAGAFLVLLVPWTVSASLALDGPVLMTTSVPDALANTFGDSDKLCYGPCDPESTVWFGPVRYSREVARATGLSEVEVQSRMSAYARQDVTVRSYLTDLPITFRNYLKDPGHYVVFVDNPDASRRSSEWIDGTTNRMIYSGFVLGLVGVVAGLVRRGRTRVPAMLIGLCAAGLLTQPFVHVSGSRYWATIGPLLGLGVALSIDVLRSMLVDRRSRQD